ncbi:MAG: hypothetical protein HY231_18030 [Acidobacteria bacterium]|nr:hypothetical protein [Acidobacteriota bacterium]
MMISSRYLLLPFAAQMLCMLFDEFYFHWQRKLPRWERLGHPLDTLTVLMCWSVILLVPPTAGAITLYAGLSLFSCLFVTKDEWVHQAYCPAGEHWLHAVLFVLHPLLLISAALLWPTLHAPNAAAVAFGWIRYEGFEGTFFAVNSLLTLLFGFYQLLYWNVIWKANSSTTKSTKS